MINLAIVSGGLREPSSTRLLADHIATALRTELGKSDAEVTWTVIELRPLARAIIDAMLTGYPNADLEAVFDTIASADGLVAVTPAFNASFSGLFKSFFDVLPEDTISDMPVMMAATGGTERHSLVLEHAMRPMFSYLHCVVSPTGVYAATDDFGSQQGVASLSHRIAKAASDFSRLLQSCGQRPRRDAWDEELTAMEQLLSPRRVEASTDPAHEEVEHDADRDGPDLL
jgi:FMN reductase